MLRIAVIPSDGTAAFQWREPFEDADAAPSAVSQAQSEFPGATIQIEELIHRGDDSSEWVNRSEVPADAERVAGGPSPQAELDDAREGTSNAQERGGAEYSAPFPETPAHTDQGVDDADDGSTAPDDVDDGE